jgi:hypothetical protein
VLCDLLEAGIKNGCCSANDIRDITFNQPNIIGGIFKILPKFGFLHTDRRVKTIARKKHARRVDVWEVKDMAQARDTLDKIQSIILGKAKELIKQQELF